MKPRHRRAFYGRVVRVQGTEAFVLAADGQEYQAVAGLAQVGDWVELSHGKAAVVARPVAYGRGTGRSQLREQHVQRLRSRSEALRATRQFFYDRDFVEIEPSVRVETPGMELHIDAVEAAGRYLITSPEYQMKRLLVEGHQRIFTLARCFRGGERGRQHSVEFTMLEWYRAFADLEEVRIDTENLVAHVASAVSGRAELRVGERVLDATPPYDVVTVRQLFADTLGVDLEGDEDVGRLREKLAGAGVDLGTAEHWDDMFYCAFVDRIDAAIAERERPVFVVDWPIRLGALAQAKAGDPRWVERFELYAAGVELANAFGELTDAAEQRARLLEEQLDRKARNKPGYPLDERFLSALEHGMPPSAGIALGFDRLAMVVSGAEHIGDVQAFGDGDV